MIGCICRVQKVMNNRSVESESSISSNYAPAGELSKYLELDHHIQNLIAKNHPRIMILEKPIPDDYPWQDFLRKHFAEPPFTLSREDYEYFIVGNAKIMRVKESRRPTTFYSLLRFIEYFRTSLQRLEKNLAVLETKYEQIQKTSREKCSLRGLLKNQNWDYDSISNKHNILKQTMDQKAILDEIQKKIGPHLENGLNITSRWQHMIEPMYQAAINFINNNFTDTGFNLRMFYPLKAMEMNMTPYYIDAMKYAVDLNEAIIQTDILKKNL